MKRDTITIDDVPELPGFIPVAKVAEMYGLNKGTIYHMIFKTRQLNTVFKVVKGGEDKRPLLLLSEKEVEKVMGSRERSKQAKDHTHTRLLNDWNKRVKQWGRDTGWDQTPIFVSGPPHRILEAAYVAAVPDDPRPQPQAEPEPVSP